MIRDAKATIEADEIQSTYDLTEAEMEQVPIGSIEEDMISAGLEAVEEWVTAYRLRHAEYAPAGWVQEAQEAGVWVETDNGARVILQAEDASDA